MIVLWNYFVAEPSSIDIALFVCESFMQIIVELFNGFDTFWFGHAYKLGEELGASKEEGFLAVGIGNNFSSGRGTCHWSLVSVNRKFRLR
jgi:hypothetical protein